MAIIAHRNSMSVGLAVCVVMFLAQAFLHVSAQMPSGPMMAPTGAPMYAPESAPMHAPEMAPILAPPMSALEKAPAMAPKAPPAYTPEISSMDAPTYAPGSSVVAPGPSPIESGATRSVVSSAGVVFMGLAAYLLY